MGDSEALAFGSLLIEGMRNTLTGQDTVRGTFSHRHAAFTDTQTERKGSANNVSSDQCAISDLRPARYRNGRSRFELCYSGSLASGVAGLVGTQFGDFFNAAQVIIDQFISSGEEKWNQTSRIVLLLPHGYEGQGPEHSSARLERFLQLCAEGNMQVAYCSTPAQYFHLLRRQVKQPSIKPLVLMSPKSLLRLPDLFQIALFTSGGFLPVLGETRRTKQTPIAYCSRAAGL